MGRLLVVRAGNLKQLKLDKAFSTQAASLW